MIRTGVFAAESVSEGHPDKLADRIADAILDEFLALDPNAQVLCEAVVTNQFIMIIGEFTARGDTFDVVQDQMDALVRRLLRNTGYRHSKIGIDPAFCHVELRLRSFAPDIALHSDRRTGIAAQEQRVIFGYACDETPELMPAPITYAHRLMRRQSALHKSGVLPWLRPDAQCQVTFRYENGRPVAIESVFLSTQHSPEISTQELRAAVFEYIIAPVIPLAMRSKTFVARINPMGRFVVGGPKAASGLTGRRINGDTYGGSAPHGGSAFSGKDPSKVDRAAAYMARFLAKQVVARGWANRCLTQIAYGMGVAEPINFAVDTEGTGVGPDEDIAALLRMEFDLRLASIIEKLDLKRPIYLRTAAYGHFGRDEFSWEAVTAA